VRRYERETETYGFGVSIPILLGIWLVCAVIAGLVWQNLVSNTPGAVSISPVAMIVLSAGFGFAGAGLTCLAVDIIRKP
jgi:hypothetical protein